MRVVRRLFFLLTLSFISSLAIAKEIEPLAGDFELEQRVIAISEDLRCLVCQNESLAGSQADLAKDLRREIREQLKQGKSDREIVEFLVQRYGDFVLYRPPLKSFTLLLWFGPLILLLLGGGALLVSLKRRQRLADIEAPLSKEQKSLAENLLKLDDNNL